jgi:phosphoribosylformylglycinamidine synthase PurS subunit
MSTPPKTPIYEGKAKKSIEQMCEKLLANTVIEKYAIELVA